MTDPTRGYTQRQRNLILAVLALLLAALAGGGVLLIRHAARSPVILGSVSPREAAVGSPRDVVGPAPDTGKTAPEPEEASDPAEKERWRQQAEDHLRQFVLIQEQLERMGAAQWGEDGYAEVLRFAQEGDARLVEKDYEVASKSYEAAITRARELAASSGDVLERLVAEGKTALSENNNQMAGEKFSMALRIDSSNEPARLGLKRAKVAEKVNRLIHSGNQHEEENRLAFALADYGEALRLDPSSVQANDAAARVKDRIAGEQFEQLMSLGFSFFTNGKYDHAQKAFEKATALEPDSVEAREALAQVEQSVQLLRISDLKGEALVSERAENWEQALASYQAVLDINPAIQFAIQGKERCLERIQIRNRMQVYLDRPDLLESQGHREDALQILNRASTLQDKGPKLTARTAELDRLVQLAKTPIQVILLSDNLTDVSVYRVGRFGKFHRLALDLRPGTYTAVGSRVGYKDVRQEIVVTADKEPAPITIRCEEKI